MSFSFIFLLDAGSHVLCTIGHVPHCLEDPCFVAILNEVRSEPAADCCDKAASDIKAFSFQSSKGSVMQGDFAKADASINYGVQSKLHFSVQVRTPTSSPKSTSTSCSPNGVISNNGSTNPLRSPTCSPPSSCKKVEKLSPLRELREGGKHKEAKEKLGENVTNEDKKEKTTDTDKNLSNITDKAKDQHDEDINGENQEKDHQEPEEDDESPKDNTYEAKNDDTQEKDPQELENVDVKKPEEQHPEAVNDDSQEKDHEELEDKDEEKPEDQDPEAVKDDKQEKDQELEEEEEEECREEGEESFEEDTLGQEDPSLQMAGVLEVHPSEDVDTVNILLCIADPWCKLITVGEKTWEIRSKQTHKRALPSLRFFHMFQSRCCYFHLRFGLPYTSELGQETSAN